MFDLFENCLIPTKAEYLTYLLNSTGRIVNQKQVNFLLNKKYCDLFIRDLASGKVEVITIISSLKYWETMGEDFNV